MTIYLCLTERSIVPFFCAALSEISNELFLSFVTSKFFKTFFLQRKIRIFYLSHRDFGAVHRSNRFVATIPPFSTVLSRDRSENSTSWHETSLFPSCARRGYNPGGVCTQRRKLLTCAWSRTRERASRGYVCFLHGLPVHALHIAYTRARTFVAASWLCLVPAQPSIVIPALNIRAANMRGRLH